MEQKIVVHMKDGAIHKGVTHDFGPQQPTFHLLPAEGGGVPLKVSVDGMKALFWVKDYVGNREFVARRDFPSRTAEGRRAVLTFLDGETIWGSVTEDDPASAGFFFIPADDRDNNIRIFIVRASLKELRWAP